MSNNISIGFKTGGGNKKLEVKNKKNISKFLSEFEELGDEEEEEN